MDAEEKAAASMLAQHLRSEGHRVTYKDGNDPPDFEFQVDGEIWYVEHTRIYQYVDDDKLGMYATPRIDAEREEMKRALEALATKASWSFYVKVPLTRAQARHVCRLAEQAILQDNVTAFRVRSNVVECDRRPGNASVRCRTFVPAGVVSQELERAMVKALQEKTGRMAMFNHSVKKVLLLDNRYPLADVGEARDAASLHPDLSRQFYRVYWLSWRREPDGTYTGTRSITGLAAGQATAAAGAVS